MNKLIIVVSSLMTSFAFAGADVDQKVEQLKTNSDNSKKNLEQYEANLSTVQKNIQEIDTALATLRKQRKQIQSNKSVAAKNKMDLNRQKQGVNTLISREKVQIDKEQAQIDKLQAKIADLQKNQKKREDNIAEYNGKNAEIDKEIAKWQSQEDQVIAIETEINLKEKTASTERDTWVEKKRTYEAEVQKWTAEARDAGSNYKKYKRLKDN